MLEATNQGSPDDEAAAIRTAAAALLRTMASLVRAGSREIGVTASLTLITLDTFGPRRVTELAAAEGVSQPSMSGIVNGLERAGLVERRRDRRDRRVVLVALAPEGRRYVTQRRDAAVARLAELLEGLAEEEIAAFRALAPALERLSVEAARRHLDVG